MIPWFKSDIGQFVNRLFFVLSAIFVLRIVFLFANYHYFSDLEPTVIFRALLYSIRLDVALLLWLNGLLLLFVALFPLTYHQTRKIFSFIFTVVNGLLLFLLVCDNIYFSYTSYRISYDTLLLIPQSFNIKLLLIYCIGGWYWLLLLATVIFLYTKIFLKVTENEKPWHKYKLKQRLFSFVIASIICIVAIRGFESRPLSPSSVLLYFPSKIINLASNTGFNLLYSYYKGQKPLTDKKYFTSTELDKRFQIFHRSVGSGDTTKPNIILMVMESFARDYLDSSSKFKAKTPFLDSLMNSSLVFRNGFSNGRESTHGLVAILASLPPFMQLPYYHSQYHAVSIRGLGKILTEQGYDCNFFLGDVDDSFGFKEFTHSIGITHYYSKVDFGDDRFYNGAWGIHDENFFLYAADVLSKKQVPFFATIYNVSSHPPYIIPGEHRKRFTLPGQNAAQNSVSYVDYAYQAFFKKVKNEKWFNNTIFIFIADHFLAPSVKKELTVVNNNEIPFFIYAPGISSLRGERKYIVQQLDIVPTILNLTGYGGKYMSMGHSALDGNQPRYAVQKFDYIYQIIDSSYVLGLNYDNDEIHYLYRYRTDTLLKNNLIHDPGTKDKKEELNYQLKAMIQRYNNSFLNNQLFY